jgi:hypothetical protein
MILEKQESHFANGFSTSIKYQLLIDDGRTRQFEGIGAAFVGTFQDDKVSQILELPKLVEPIGIICLGYPAETPEKLARIDISKLVHFEEWW